MIMSKTYRIVGKTNPWIAQRDTAFNGKTEVTFYDGLTLSEAKTILLHYFCKDYDLYAPNWGVAMNSRAGRDNASRYQDGTYSYWWDSRTYAIEEEQTYQLDYVVELNGKPVESGSATFREGTDDEEQFVYRMNDKWQEDYEDCVEVLFR